MESKFYPQFSYVNCEPELPCGWRIGTAFGSQKYTILRPGQDFLFGRKEDVERAIDSLAAAGYTEFIKGCMDGFYEIAVRDLAW